MSDDDRVQDPFGLLARVADAWADGVPVTGAHVVAVDKAARAAGTVEVVVLDRVADLPRADTPYCIHGQTTCVRCNQWCWLGDRSLPLVSNGQCAPLCRPCANATVPKGHRRLGNAGDHRRADGEH